MARIMSEPGLSFYSVQTTNRLTTARHIHRRFVFEEEQTFHNHFFPGVFLDVNHSCRSPRG
jgi:hypothetical protein